jgi:hypothetical protein
VLHRVFLLWCRHARVHATLRAAIALQHRASFAPPPPPHTSNVLLWRRVPTVRTSSARRERHKRVAILADLWLPA